MKPIARLFLPAALAIITTAGCEKSKNGEEKYNATFELTNVSGVKVKEIGSGLNSIDMTLFNPNYSLQLSFGTREEELPAAQFTYSTSIAEGKFTARLTAMNQELALGSDTAINISRSEGNNYDITLTSTVGKDRIKGHFTGIIKFTSEIEVGDPSGHLIMISERDAVDDKGNIKSGVTKYEIRVYDPDGRELYGFDAVNESGLGLAELVGTYTMTSYPTQSWTMDNGWVYPQYGIAGGSFYTDNQGTVRYTTKGAVTISAAKDKQGNPLYSFSGEGLETLTAQNQADKGGSFSVKFSTEINGGHLSSDQIIESKVLGMDMLYTVFLPKSWDGKKKFPVIYLLHGAESAPGNNKWYTDGSFAKKLSLAIALDKAPEMIVITPNCTVNGQNLFYCNGYQGGKAQYMTFFFEEFMPEMEKMYHIKSERSSRLISGLSMGGYGSLYYGGLHPEMFSYVYACSPATYMDGAPDLSSLYSNDLKEGKTLPGLTIEIGTEDFLFQSADYFKQYLDGIGVQCEYITRPGAHDWAFWTVCADKIIAKAATLFK